MSFTPPTLEVTAETMVQIALRSLQTDGPGFQSPYSLNTGLDSKVSFADGSVESTLNIHRVHAQRVVLTPASGTYDVDLQTVLDPHGNVCNFQRVKCVYVKNRIASGGYQLVMSPGASNGWTALWKSSATPGSIIDPGGKFFQESSLYGFAVTSINKVLRFTHNGGSSGSITFDLVVVGF